MERSRRMNGLPAAACAKLSLLAQQSDDAAVLVNGTLATIKAVEARLAGTLHEIESATAAARSLRWIKTGRPSPSKTHAHWYRVTDLSRRLQPTFSCGYYAIRSRKRCCERRTPWRSRARSRVKNARHGSLSYARRC